MTFLEALKDYSALISAGFSLAALGFLVHIANLIRNAAKDKIEVLEKENQILKDEVDRTDKWYLRDIEKLKSDLAENENQLRGSLIQADLDLETLISESSKKITVNVKQSIETIVSEMLEKMDRIDRFTETVDPRQYLELSKGLMAVGRWEEAGEQLDKYVAINPFDWEIQLSRAVSYSNAKKGTTTNLAALRAYNDTIAFFYTADGNVDQNTKARLFAYRGAILKRLGHYAEAESDLHLAEQWATESYEIRDTIYNIVCIKALKHDRRGLLDAVSLLKRHPGYEQQLEAIKGHLNDYFVTYATDEEFLELIRN